MSNPWQDQAFQIHPVGVVERTDEAVRVRVFEPYADALEGLGDFSHVVVLWWFDRNESPEGRGVLQVRPRRDPSNPLTGVFACRAPYRPNLIAVDVCRILAIDGLVLHVDKTHAFDNTPIVDLKPYIPNLDEAHDVRLPDWVRR